MTWLSTWLQWNRPHYADHDTEQQAIEHAKTKRAAGFEAVHFEIADQEAS